MIAAPATPDSLPRYAIDVGRPQDLAGTEWLLTNGLGGFAMGTALGMPTRRYHGLLVAALSPPVQRDVMLHSLADEVVLDRGGKGEQRAALTPFCFRGGGPCPPPPLVRFEKDVSCRWHYRIGDAEVVKDLHLHHARNAVSVSYEVRAGRTPLELTLRPLVAMRNSHGLLSSADPAPPCPAGVSERGLTLVRGATRLELWTDHAPFRLDPQWWYGFEYPCERERGFECHEDLYSPGTFALHAPARGEARATVTAWIGERPGDPADDRRSRARRVRVHADAALSTLPSSTPGSDRDAVRRLVLAADDFIARRREPADPAKGTKRPSRGCTIIAGYPWFTDWGRDALVSLPGLLLVTGRRDDALSVLSTLASFLRRGLIPNVFDDQSGEPHYNAADASLWFLHAACEYLRASGDHAAFNESLRPACLGIIEAYASGTDSGIHVDPRDGLVSAGDPTTQLTWMDAKRDGVVFTPRHGKPVELSALWHHGLLAVADAIAAEDGNRAGRLRDMAAACAAGFGAFWNPAKECLYDVLQPGENGRWRPNDQVRPNQIFAVSLAHSPLEERRKRAVVQCVRARLLTPHGFRTLDPTDPAYKGRFTGPIFERDAAYHNGAAWPWLMGPFAEAVLRVGHFSAAARADARTLLRPLIARLDAESLGQLPEVFDGDDRPEAPQQPGGCPAQAWSVAEVLRVLVMASAGQ